MPAGALLVMGRPDHRHQHAQEHAHDKGQGGDPQGGEDALQIERPAAALDEGPVEVHEEVLPPGQVGVGHQLGGQVAVKLSPFHGHSPLSVSK